MTELPGHRDTTGDHASGLSRPAPGEPAGPGSRRLSPKARLAADAAVGLAVALVASFALVMTGSFWGMSLGLALFWIAFALVWGLAAPTARLALEHFWEGWERHVEGLQERGPDRRGLALADGPAVAPGVPVARNPGDKDAERQLLEAIERHGEVTAARVALETALTVTEADRRLGELAEKGHLEVSVRDGKLVYSF